jgi:hypothetical protein
MRKQNFSIDELEVNNITGSGGHPLIRKIIYFDPTNGNDGNTGLSYTKARKTLTSADNLITTNKGDAIVYIQGTSGYSIAAAYDWTFNMSRLIGNGADHYAGQRARIGESADVNMLTISGYGNHWKNLYIQHGYSTTHVSHTAGITLTGNYTTLENVHISSPLSTGQASDESYGGALRVTGTGFQYFKHCTFGNLSVERTHAKGLIQLGTGTCSLFEDCTFLTRIGDADPYFFEIENTSGLGQLLLKNCGFYSMSTNMATKMEHAFHYTGSTTWMTAIDQNCQFYGITHMSASACPYNWRPTVFAATDDSLNLIAITSEAE